MNEDVAPGNELAPEDIAAAQLLYGKHILNDDGKLTEQAIADGWRFERARIDVTQNGAHPEYIDGPWDLIAPRGPDPIDDVSESDYAGLVSGGLDPDLIRAVVVMHRGLHHDKTISLSPDACPEPGHSWGEMIERYDKLKDTPQLAPSEPLREWRQIPLGVSPLTAMMRAVPYTSGLPLGLRINPDGTIPVDGRCPVCAQGTLVIGAQVVLTDLASNAVTCTNTTCINPGAVNKLLNAWGGNQATRLKKVENIDLPDTPVEAGQADLLARYTPPAGEARRIVAVDLNNGRDEAGVCTECGSNGNEMHANWCSWAPAPEVDDYPVDPDADDPDDLFDQAFDQVYAEADDSESGTTTFTPAQRPVGSDPADRPLYTCHPDRCGATPAQPCKAARESMDAQHNDLITLEVPDQ